MKASDIIALPLQIGSAVRRRRIFHPVGILADGHIERTAPPTRGLPIESTDVIARVSKAVGTPAGLPDLIGLAWRMPPAPPDTRPWDVLMASTGSGPVARFTLLPTTSWTDTTLSTLMPLRWNGESWWLKAHLSSAVPGGLSVAAVDQALGVGDIVFDIEQAKGAAPFEPLAKLTLVTRIPTDENHDVSFDPTRNTRAGIQLGPQWLTELRERAYMRSRRGRDAPDEPA